MRHAIVKDVIKDYVIHTLRPEDTVDSAVRLMSKVFVGAILITGQDGSLQGIFSERDLLNRVVAGQMPLHVTKLRDVMTVNPQSIDLNSSVDLALELMDRYGCRHLPVVNSENRSVVVAMLSIRDVYRAYSKTLREHNEVLQDNVVELQRDVTMKNAYIFGAY
jgi:CBS domain-containing protein